MMPEELYNKIKKVIKREWKIAFFSAVIIGLLTHMYIFTNMLPNHDGLINIYNSQFKFSSGRFFLGALAGISSYFYLPWVNGILSVLYLALTTVVFVEIFELRKTSAIILTAGLMLTFPTIAATFNYMFTADGYMAAMLITGLAVLLTKKYKYGFIPGAILFYISVGTYQANLTFELNIVTVWFISELALNKIALKRLFVLIGRFVAMTVIGMGLYAITFKGYQKFYHGPITNYQGLNQVGGHVNYLHELRVIAHDNVFFFFRGFFTSFPVNLFEVLNLLFFILLAFAIILSIIKHKVYASPSRVILMFVSLILLPIFAYLLYFVSPGVEYHMLMVMGLMLIYLVPIVIYNQMDKPTFSVKWYAWGTLLLSFLIVFNFAIIDNIDYFNLDLKYQRSYATVNRMLDRIQQTKGYSQATELAVIGRLPMHTKISTDTVSRKIPVMTGGLGEIALALPYHYQYMMANQFGVTFSLASPTQLKNLEASAQVKNMQPWPAPDSVKIIGHVIVLKVGK